MPAETLASPDQTTSEPLWHPPKLHKFQWMAFQSKARNRTVMAGRRGGKTLLEECEAFDAGQLRGLPVGWFSPTYKILLDAWEDIQRRFGPFIRDKSESEHRLWWRSGAVLEFWSLDSGVIGRSRKYGLAVVDEAGLVPNLDQRWRADIEPTLLDLDGRGLFGSTPNLVGPEFTKLYARGVPANENWASFRWSSLDNPYLPANVAERIAQLRKDGVPEWIIRQEYFAEPAESDRAFFRAADIEAHKTAHGRAPVMRGSVVVPEDRVADRFAIVKAGKLTEGDGDTKRDLIAFRQDAGGPLRLWAKPDPSEIHCIGADLGYGVGSSNTVFSIGNRHTRRKVAEYAWPGVTPDEAAMLCAMLGYWFAGPTGPAWICFERNGPGEVFAKRMHELEYGALWHERKGSSAIDNLALTMKYGWWNSDKEPLLGAYRASMLDGKFINPSIPALDECQSYQYDDQMCLKSSFDRTKSRDDPARVKHGDRCIADSLLNLCFDWTYEPVPKAPPTFAPGSYGDIFKLAERLPEVFPGPKPVGWTSCNRG